MLDIEVAKYIPWLPLIAAGLCGLCCCRPAWRKFAGPICTLSILAGLLITVGIYSNVPQDGTFRTINFFRWIDVGSLSVGFSYFLDPLTLVMLFVVTGMGTLIATYAMGYMKGDEGYARFFAAVSLFIFAMTTLVMADNLILLYLGWEGVGLCSYLLIGYYHKHPVAVKAAKKAFIVNRIGDLGFALGIFLTYMTFDSVQYDVIIPAAQRMLEANDYVPTAALTWIPFLLMLGAFGKSAQLPLHVWLPDAMAGPTPVSALIHAATMVTAGVFMIARLTPVFELSPYALPTVGVIGAITCIFAATIALCSNDLKGIFAYSTVSQLGYMFIGVAAFSVGGVFHLFTHAFFKALLFLTAGSVMHALAGTLDIRAISGMRKKMPVTCWLMFFGCLALAGFPFTSGFFSKDLILGDVLALGLNHGDFHNWYMFAAILGLITAGVTAFYTFRLWFTVFMGEERYSFNGRDHTPDNDLEIAMIAVASEHLEHARHHAEEHGDHSHVDEPHEMPFWPMNAPLVVLALGSIAFGLWAAGEDGWMANMLNNSTQLSHHGEATVHHEGMNPHHLAMYISIAMAIGGIGLAALFYWWRRDLVAVITRPLTPIVTFFNRKYYIDELYDTIVVKPLRGIGHFCYIFDDLVINSLVMLVGWLPRILGLGVRPAQHGKLQGYGVGMAFGVGVIALFMFYYWGYPQ